MIKRNITFKDLDGNDVSEDWYFHYREDELIELELTQDISGKFDAIVKGKAEGKEAVGLIKSLLQSAVGRRSADGRRFDKNPDILEEFTQTGAYSALLMDLLGDPTGAATFVNSLMPAGMEERISALAAQQGKDVENLPLPKTETLAPPKAPNEMSREELIAAMRERNKA